MASITSIAPAVGSRNFDKFGRRPANSIRVRLFWEFHHRLVVVTHFLSFSSWHGIFANIGSVHLFSVFLEVDDSVMSSDAKKALPVWVVVFEPIPNPAILKGFGRSPGRSSTRSSGSAHVVAEYIPVQTYQTPVSETSASDDLKTHRVRCWK